LKPIAIIMNACVLNMNIPVHVGSVALLSLELPIGYSSIDKNVLYV